MSVSTKNKHVIMIIITIMTMIVSFVGMETGHASLIVISVFACIGLFYWFLRSCNYHILTNTVFLFPLVGGVYLLVYPTLRFIFKLLPTGLLGISDGNVISGTFFGGTMISLYILMVVMIPKNKYLLDTESAIYKGFSLSARNIAFDFLFFLVLLYMIRRYISIGGYAAVFSGSISRQVMSKELEIIPFYSYIKYAYISYTVYALYSVFNSTAKTTSKYARVFRAVIVCLFWVLDLSLGNRRGLLYVLLAMMLYFTNNSRKRIKPAFYFAVLGIVVSFMLVGVLRNANNTGFELKIKDAFGEAIYPMHTLYYYVGHHVRPYYCGATFLYILAYFVPRSIWPAKPISLANQFRIDYYNSIMGYAFTPFSEMFVNFSYYGIVIGAVFYSALFNWLSKNKEKYPIFYLATYMELINFFRGEFASSIIEVLVMYFTLKALCIVNGNSVTVREIRDE